MEERKPLGLTEVGVFIDGESDARINRYRMEMDELRREMEKATADGYLRSQDELQREKLALEEHLNKITQDRVNFSSQYSEERQTNSRVSNIPEETQAVVSQSSTVTPVAESGKFRGSSTVQLINL